MNKQNYAKYRLELLSVDDTYVRYRVKNLKMSFYKSTYMEGKYEDFGGACGLLKNSEHPGYCNLCMTYHSYKSDELPSPGYIVEFSPLCDQNGQEILIRYDHDEMMTSIDRGYKDYVTGEMVDCSLTVWKHGTFDGFKNR
jgi:hypothetical protein